jgi:phosphoenolpyruvate carboxykinase (GTP)
LFTNVALTADNEPWWEGRKLNTPVLDWQGRPFDPAKGDASAHPNSRFTVSARNNPIYSPRCEDPDGVPISAIVFGGRRREVAPLVYEARNWQHGVLVGASVASETTAAATGAVGVVRRDPMAMKPFAGYNFGDYWRHWLEVGKRLKNPPRLFHVNWFRRDAAGKFLWPGFGDNLRVMEWILKRCAGQVHARESAIGYLPDPGDLNLAGVDVSAATMNELLAVHPGAWRNEVAEMREYLREFGDRAPAEMYAELDGIERRLQ